MNQPKTESLTPIEVHLAALYGRINYERHERVTPRHFKLQNMREILRRLKDPHLEYPVVHVAGTKGKGSVSTMVGQILTASGRRTGVYTSPHLETIHQRMVVDGNLITDQQLVDTLTAMGPTIEAMDLEADQLGHRHLTFFEITTAAAFYFFAQQKCEAVVLEVGLGGRLDSTNVCQPVTCIITNISLDHTRQLGSTVDKIAFEKAGIIKPGVPVISGAIDREAADVIEEVAAKNGSPLFVLGKDFSVGESDSDSTQAFSTQGKLNFQSSRSDQASTKVETHAEHSYSINDIELSIIGGHQRVNAGVAVAAVESLNARGWNVSADSIRLGLSRTMLSGRTEVISRNPTVVIDIAHNVASVDALVAALKHDLQEWKSASKRTLVLAISRDKDAKAMLRPLVEIFDEIVFTKYLDNPRSRATSELVEFGTEIRDELIAAGKSAAEFLTEPTPEGAWKRATQDLHSDQLICISGSAFLIAELRKPVMDSMSSRL